MNDSISKFVIYYRDLPNIIETVILSDGKMQITKDGVKKMLGGQSSPRITLIIHSKKNSDPKTRIKEIIYMLDELESNNQIIGYKKVS